MEVKRYSINRVYLTLFGCVVLLSMTSMAQEVRSEVSVQGTGFFTKDSSGNGVDNKATKTGGVLIGYRYSLTRWLAAEANYGYDRTSQLYVGAALARVQTNVHQITGSAVVKLPLLAKIQPFALVGGGGLVFDPTDNAGGTFTGASQQTRGAFLYGGGVDYAFTKHLSLRGEYRGFVYKAPDFNLASLNADTWTHIAQPSAGIVFHF
jgi:outer membrane immunogenic protein